MDDNNLGGQNPELDSEQNTEQDNTPLIDKMLQNNPFVKINQGNLQNVQTQSVVKSTREEANEQLAQINARNAEIARQQKLAEDAAKAKRTIIYVILGIFFAAILAAGIWLAVNAIVAGQKGIAPSSTKKEEEQKAQYGKVEGYKCKTETCVKAADIAEKKILVRDGSGYYLYNTEKSEATLTTIPEQDYHAITPFVWGGKTYVVIDPESAQSALYSITDNRQVTEFAYDEFFYDAKSAEYNDMTWTEGKYIVAKSAGTFNLIQLSNGKSVLQAAKRVFIHDDFLFGYESDGSIHVYSSTGTQFLVAKAVDKLFTNGTYIIHFDENNGYVFYAKDGQQADDEQLTRYLSDISIDQSPIDVLSRNSSYYCIPASQ